MQLYVKYPMQELLEDYVADTRQFIPTIEPGVTVTDVNDVNLEPDEQQNSLPVADTETITPTPSTIVNNEQLSEDKLKLFRFNLFVVFQKLDGGKRCWS